MLSPRIYQTSLLTVLLLSFPFLLLAVENKRLALYDLAVALPYIAFCLVGFLGEKMNQRRILWTALLFIGTYAYLCYDLPKMIFLPRQIKSQILCYAFPLTLFILFRLKANWMRGRMSVPILLLTLLLPTAILHLAFLSKNPALHEVLKWRPQIGYFFSHNPSLGVFIGLLFMFFTPKTEDRYYKLFHAFTAVSLIPLLYCFERSGGHFASTTKFLLEVSICFLSSASVLIYANFSLYWQKVYMDELTDVPNRRALNEKLISLRGNYFLAMIDVDHFKQFNDTHGHEQGDTVLRFVASHFSKTPGAEVFRYGGEEFCLVVKNDSLIEAAEAVDENRKSLAKREFTIRSPRQIRLKKGKSFRNKTSGPGIKVHLTVSGGIAGPLTEFTNNDDVLRAADKALYHAKEKGRNQVAMSEKKSIVSLSDKKAS